MSKGKSNYKPTKNGFKEVDDEKEEEELKKTVPSKEEEKEIEKLSAKQEREEAKEEKQEEAKLDLENDLSVPYPELGHTVSQLSAFPEHKRQSILGGKDKEFCKKYHL
jgi:hypothetical protein